MSGELTGVRIVTPGDWTDLDLDPATRHRSVCRAVRRAVARDPLVAPHAQALLRLLDSVTRRAADGGIFCSSLVLGSTGDLLVANVLIQLAPATLVTSVPADDVCAGLAMAVSRDEAWAGADVSVVLLPLAGPAVRLEVVARGVCVQYLVPISDQSRQIVLTFTSPGAACAEALIDLFDSMAASFGFTYESADSSVVVTPNE